MRRDIHADITTTHGVLKICSLQEITGEEKTRLQHSFS